MAGQQFGVPPKNIANLDYTGADIALLPVTEAQRDPNTSDKNYPIDCFWRNTVTRSLWFLSGFNSTGALWVMMNAGSGQLTTLSDTAGTVVTPSGSGNIQLRSTSAQLTIVSDDPNDRLDFAISGPVASQFTVQAATVPGVTAVTPTPGGVVTVNAQAVAAHSVPIETRSRALNAYNVEAQYSSAVAATDATKSGLAHFNSTQFSVDANGFVALVGGGVAIDQIGVDAFTAPGSNPVIPNPGTGQVTVTGAQVAAGVVGANVIRTDSLVANTYTIEIQRSTAVGATASVNNGVCHFNSAQFSVDGNAFVSMVGGSGPAIQTLTVDTFTAPALTNVVSPSSGTITITGAQVATGTVGANVIRTDSKAAGAYTIEVQRSTAVAATDSTKNGVAHFDSADFSVDGNGFVSLNGTGIFLWQTTSANIANLSVNHGYICIAPGGALTLGLPATAALGDELEITLDGATSFQITQAAGQQIRISNLQTTLGATGSITTTDQGNTIRMVAQSATKWNVLSYIGNLTVA